MYITCKSELYKRASLDNSTNNANYVPFVILKWVRPSNFNLCQPENFTCKQIDEKDFHDI